MINAKTLNLFERLDLFGVPITIRFNQKETHKTYFGACITLIIVAILILQLVNTINDVMNYKNVNYIFQENTVDLPSRFDIAPDKFIFAFGIDQNLKHFIDESVYNVEAIMAESKKFFNQTSQQYEFVTKELNFKPVRCTPDHFQVVDATKYFLTLPYKDLYCLPIGIGLNLEGQYGADVYRRLRFRIRYCSGSGCADLPTLQKKLDNISLKIYYVNYAVKITELENPFRPIGMNNFWQSSFSIMKNINIYFRNAYLESNEGIVQPVQRNYHNLIYAFDREQLVNQSDRMMFEVYISLDKNKESQYIRKYQNLSQGLSQLGGLFNFLFSFGCIICYPLSRLLLQKKLLNSIFSFINETPNDNNNNYNTTTNKDKNFQFIESSQQNGLINQQGFPQTEFGTILMNQTKGFEITSPHNQIQLIRNESVKENEVGCDKLVSSIQSPKKFSRMSESLQKRLTNQGFKSKQESIYKDEKNSKAEVSAQKIMKSSLKEGKQPDQISKMIQESNAQQDQGNIKKSLSQSIFKITANTIKIKISDIFGGLFSKSLSFSNQRSQRTQMISYALEKLNNQLDIYKIINKLIELEKLKQLLLNEDQRKLFEFIPQPVINEQEFKNGQLPTETLHQKLQASILFDDKRTYMEKAEDAQEAYYNIFKQPERKITKIDQQLLMLIDPKISQQFEMSTCIDGFALNSAKKYRPTTRFEKFSITSNPDESNSKYQGIQSENGQIFGHKFNTTCNKYSEVLGDFATTQEN